VVFISDRGRPCGKRAGDRSTIYQFFTPSAERFAGVYSRPCFNWLDDRSEGSAEPLGVFPGPADPFHGDGGFPRISGSLVANVAKWERPDPKRFATKGRTETPAVKAAAVDKFPNSERFMPGSLTPAHSTQPG